MRLLHARLWNPVWSVCSAASAQSQGAVHYSTWRGWSTEPAPETPQGLFGIPELRQPSDFTRMMKDAKYKCEDLKTSLLHAPADAQVVRIMDEMSDTLCRCYDAAEACRNIHDDPTWRSAASAVCHDLGAYISVINHHQGLYAQLSKGLARAGYPRSRARHTPLAPLNTNAHSGSGQAADSSVPPPAPPPPTPATEQWDPETLRVAQQLALDMEKAGIHLPERSRQRMQTLMNENNHYAMSFNKVLLDARQLGSCRVRGSMMVLSPSNVGAIMANETDEATRQQVWRAASRSPASNLTLLEGIIAARTEQAHLLGFHSYSHYKAAGSSLAGNPHSIVTFLKQLAAEVKPLADQEIQALRRVKASVLGAAEYLDHVVVQPWDTEYLMGHRRRAQGALHTSVLQEYTHLPLVLEGLSELVRRSMGITLHIRPAAPQESWAHGVLRCDAHHEDSGHMGTVYLDLCSRPGKYPSAVTFPIRCGRQLSDGTYQTPVMALLADFGPRYGAPEDIRLTARELRVLLHEFGHCVHNLASRTRYQHLAGTRCAQDLVELPSHLFEHFTVDPRSLRLLARHHATGDPLPQAACEAMAQQRRLFAGLEMQQQVLLALADQRLFGHQPLPVGGTSMAWAEAVAPYSSVPWIKGSHPEARMSHLTIYGATYYSYVYARCLSAAVWDKLFASDPLAPKAGEAVIRRLLSPGGAVEPVALVRGLLGESALTGSDQEGWAPSVNSAMLNTAMATFG